MEKQIKVKLSDGKEAVVSASVAKHLSDSGAAKIVAHVQTKNEGIVR